MIEHTAFYLAKYSDTPSAKIVKSGYPSPQFRVGYGQGELDSFKSCTNHKKFAKIHFAKFAKDLALFAVRHSLALTARRSNF